MRARTLSIGAVTLATAGFVAATPPTHLHQRFHHERNFGDFDKRSPDNANIVDVPGPTVIAYELNGELIAQSEVCQGIRAGTLKWADGTDNPALCSAGAPSSSQPVPTTPPAVSLARIEQKDAEVPTTPQSAATSVHEQSPSISASSVGDASISDGQGLNRDFPDGMIDCSTFPSAYGPINISWAQLGGWTGIQYVTISGNSITHIDTAVPGGQGCKPGAMCSYACPAGYQKSQWPSQQGSTGQSVGGLSCNADGKLGLTNPKLSKKLCIPGTGAVTVQNKLSTNAAICRTDYPGTENEVVPLNTQPDTTSPLTCPDASTYYEHEGDPTTAQYYINNQGVPVQTACIWGSDGTDAGNWAPSYLGVGQDTYGKTWLAISSTAQNNPSNYKPLNYTVEIVGNTSGKCRLSNGQYCSGNGYSDCNESGCTVELMSGQATYVLSDGTS